MCRRADASLSAIDQVDGGQMASRRLAGIMMLANILMKLWWYVLVAAAIAVPVVTLLEYMR